jgi:ABC-type nitrate/sulfonate/bicarbonate transport system ATPase subunit
MAQRVAIARALLCEPKILLMDEPFASLDAITRSELQQMLLQLIEEQQLHCLFVTHDLVEAELISERLVVMQQGTIAASFLKKEDSYPPNMVAEVRNYLHLR